MFYITHKRIFKFTTEIMLYSHNNTESFGIRDRATRGNKRERAVVARKRGYPKRDGANED